MNKKELTAAIKAVTDLEGEKLANAVGELIKAKNKAQSDLAELTETHSACEGEKEALKEKADQADALATEVEELTAQLEEAKEDPNALKRCNKTFKIGKKEYRFKNGILQVRLKGHKDPVLAETIAADKELRERLVKIGFSGIEEVPEKEK